MWSRQRGRAAGSQLRPTGPVDVRRARGAATDQRRSVSSLATAPKSGSTCPFRVRSTVRRLTPVIRSTRERVQPQPPPVPDRSPLPATAVVRVLAAHHLAAHPPPGPGATARTPGRRGTDEHRHPLDLVPHLPPSPRRPGPPRHHPGPDPTTVGRHVNGPARRDRAATHARARPAHPPAASGDAPSAGDQHTPCPHQDCTYEPIAITTFAGRLLDASLPPGYPLTSVLAIDSTDYETWARAAPTPAP